MSTITTNIKTEKQLIPELRFKEFDGDFQKKKIGDIAELTSSKRVYLNDYVDDGIPFYRGKEITELRAGKTPDNILYITESSYNEFKSKYGVPQKDDILITAVGTLGNVLRIKNDDKFYFKDGNLIWFRKIQESSNYLEIALEYYKRAIDKTSIGSTQRALTMVELRKLKFPFPSLPEQQKIASFLSAVDEKIQQLTKKKELLEQYKKGVMQQLFSGKLRFKDENGKSYPDWEEKRLDAIAKIVGGGTPETVKPDYWDGEIQWFTPTEIRSKYISNSKRTITQSGLSKSSAKLLPAGTILFTSRATIAELGFATQECTTNQGFQSLIVNQNNNSEFIYQLIKVKKNEFIRKSQGSTFLEISSKEIKKMKFKIPCLEEQQKIATHLSRIDTKIESVNNQITQTQTFKKGLLQQMFV
jgi:type I restriction enzyme S subunit